MGKTNYYYHYYGCSLCDVRKGTRCFGCKGICEFCDKSFGYKILMTLNIKKKMIYFCCEDCFGKQLDLKLIKFCPLCHRNCNCDPDKCECDKNCELNLNYKILSVYSKDQKKKKEISVEICSDCSIEFI
jgi:hypothetical protein